MTLMTPFDSDDHNDHNDHNGPELSSGKYSEECVVREGYMKRSRSRMKVHLAFFQKKNNRKRVEYRQVEPRGFGGEEEEKL